MKNLKYLLGQQVIGSFEKQVSGTLFWILIDKIYGSVNILSIKSTSTLILPMTQTGCPRLIFTRNDTFFENVMLLWVEDERAFGANFEKLCVFTHRKEYSLTAAEVFYKRLRNFVYQASLSNLRRETSTPFFKQDSIRYRKKFSNFLAAKFFII